MKRICWLLPFLLLTLAVLACRSTLFSDLVTQSGDTLFQDDFSNPTNGWMRASGPGGGMDYYNGTFRILVKTPDYDLWSVTGYEFNNVRVEVDAARMAGPLENRFGLICRYLDAQDFYFFIISSDGYFAIGKVTRGMRTLLGQEMMAYSPVIITGIAPNHLRVDCVDDMLAFYVNNQPIATAEDADHPSGDVGLLAGAFDTPGVDVIFDDFMVIKP